ncbi:MAG: valine dehydrogenase [Actinomycetia bacterium]|nr:valine dehydrogenase [Actinomycetes bacterium]
MSGVHVEERLSGTDHEQVVRIRDRTTGLLGYVAIHDTSLGPALGGTRFRPYPSEDDALADVLRLSRAMSYKNALAGLDHGGGKAVIIGDPTRDKTPDLLRAYGRFVAALGGRYVTACDVGTYVEDMDVVAETTRWATGRSPGAGGAGDSAVLTARGVFQGMRACAAHLWGEPSLAGRRVGVAGVGKVGRHLTGLLLGAGAHVVITDVDPAAVARLLDAHPTVEVLPDVDALVQATLDVYSPCALGGALDDATGAVLSAAVVCGGANNQLAHPGVEDALAARGVLYAPDYLVNAGGVIQVADELHGFDLARATAQADRIYATTRDVLAAAERAGATPAAAADRLAEARMAAGPWAGTLYPGLAAVGSESRTVPLDAENQVP